MVQPVRVALATLLAVLLLGAVLPVAQAQAPPVPKNTCAPASPRTGADGVLCHVNFARAIFGLPALKPDRRLGRAALRQARAIARTGKLSHTVAGRLPKRIRAARYRYSRASETLWFGAGRDTSAAMAIPAWLRSPAHAAAMLGAYRDVGIAVVFRAPGGKAGRTVVAVYGTKR